MKYVDEFRDADTAAAIAGQIAGLCEPGRHYHFMEVCGGHTHTIYKHGLEDYLPDAVTLVHGPGCPVCVIPMGRVDDAIAIAQQPDVILTSFGDMLRVPGGMGSFLDAKAEGADIRMVYSPLDALKIAKDNPDRRVVFMAIGFETTAPSTAVTVLRAARDGVENFSVFCNHVTIIPAIKAILDSPDLRLDGFLGPGHVSTVIGCRPYEFVARDHGKPLVTAGFEPLDILASVLMLMRQLSEGRGRGREPVLTRGALGREPASARGNRRSDGATAAFRVAGPGLHRAVGAAASRPLCKLRLRAPLRRTRRAGGRPEGLPVRGGPQGRPEALGVQGLRHCMYAGDSDRHLHGVERGRVRGVLQLRPVRS